MGGRASVFDDVAPGAMYISAVSTYVIEAVRFSATGRHLHRPGREGAKHARVIGHRSDRHAAEVRGKTQHALRSQYPPGNQTANSLLVVEVITPGAHWPVTLHTARYGAAMNALEETVLLRIAPAQGFAFSARVYR